MDQRDMNNSGVGPQAVAAGAEMPVKSHSLMRIILIVVVLVVVLLLVWLIFGSRSVTAPVVENLASQSSDPEVAQISTELEGLNSADLEAEFSDIEADLEQL